jgi:hypothetical protein
MIMNKFIRSPVTGSFDPSRLDTMSEADAQAIVNSLKSAGQVPGADNPTVQKKIEEALSAIDASPGTSTKDKLVDYLAKNGRNGSNQ